MRADLLDTITEINSLEMIACVHKMLNQLRRADLAERRQTYLERVNAAEPQRQRKHFSQA